MHVVAGDTPSGRLIDEHLAADDDMRELTDDPLRAGLSHPCSLLTIISQGKELR
jgi:hypothetical protein